MDRKHKHLEFIQNVINRLSTNSFLLKGWSVLLVSALMGLSVNVANLAFILLAYVPAIIFWGLDGYFLWQERAYRKLYDHVRLKEEGEIDFAMDTQTIASNKTGWASAVVSTTIVAFHGALTGTIVIVTLVLINRAG